jgi:hypothetical protein
MRATHLIGLIAILLLPPSAFAAEPPPDGPTVEQTRAFMKALAKYVFDHHLKQDRNSPQAGMLYEYYDTTKAGKLGQWIQGEALDTMHDGAWFASALAQAYRATGDPFYRDFLKDWTLPFYLKMLNHSDTLFSPDRDDSLGRNKFNKEHMLIRGEKGFVPYYWDDGASISLEALRRKTGKGAYPCRDELAGQPNPQHRLSGYSLGCSNHLAQDLAVMLMAVWPLADDGKAPLAKLRDDIAEAAVNLHQSRMKHHGRIPVVVAALGFIADPAMLKGVPAFAEWNPDNHYTAILQPAKPGRREALPGFTDGQEYFYWQSIASRPASFPRASAMRLIYDAYTLPLLYRYWSDSAAVPPGINRFDLAAIFARDGKMETYRSDRLSGTGSRMGPQNMIGCARALQLLDAFPGIWDERYTKHFSKDLRVGVADKPIQIDGKADAGYSEAVDLGQAKVRLLSDRQAMHLLGDFAGDEVEIILFSQPGGKGSRATLTLRKNGDVQATGEGGAKLLLEKHTAAGADSRTHFEIRLPYQVNKDQGAWWTAIEHGRFSIASGSATRDAYLASTESQVRKALLAELAGGLRTWQRVFQERGYIPTGMNAGSIADTRWDNLSDTGGYAHLLAAAAQYLYYLEGQRDWKQGSIRGEE